MPSIKDLLAWGKASLSNVMPVQEAVFEAAYLLGEYLKVDKSYLYAWSEKAVDQEICACYQKAIEKRLDGMPIAYIIGHKEFWSMSFKVSQDTLIPRPETEVLVETVLESLTPHSLSVLELGTGTGAIACALAKSRSMWDILAVDLSKMALAIAAENIKSHQLTNVKLIQSDWFAQVPEKLFDLIVSNPPYVEENSLYLNRDTQFEPALALFSGTEGLDAIKDIITKARMYLKSGGMLCLEHGFQQAESIHMLFKKNGYTSIKTIKDHADLDRVTFALYLNE